MPHSEAPPVPYPKTVPLKSPPPQPSIPSAPSGKWPTSEEVHAGSCTQQKKERRGLDPKARWSSQNQPHSERGRTLRRESDPIPPPDRRMSFPPLVPKPPTAKKPPPPLHPTSPPVATTPVEPTPKTIVVPIDSDSDQEDPVPGPVVAPLPKAMPTNTAALAVPQASDNESDDSQISEDNTVKTSIITMTKMNVHIKLQAFLPAHRESDHARVFAATHMELDPSTKPEPTLARLEEADDLSVTSASLDEISLEPGPVNHNPDRYKPRDLTEFSKKVFWYIRWHRRELPWTGELAHRARSQPYGRSNSRESNFGIFPHLRKLSMTLSSILRHKTDKDKCHGYMSLAALINNYPTTSLIANYCAVMLVFWQSWYCLCQSQGLTSSGV